MATPAEASTTNGTTLTRQELYDLIWSESVSAVAPRYGVSPIELSSICAAAGIPRPPRGWWVQRRAGMNVARAPLPPPAPGQEGTVTLGATPTDLPPPIALERDPANAIVVDPQAPIRHPRARQVADALERVWPDRSALRRTEKPVLRTRKYFDVRVAPESVQRTVRILDVLLTALDTRGYSVEVRRRDPRRRSSPYTTFVSVLGESLVVFLQELESKTGLAFGPGSRTGLGGKRVPTGALTLYIGTRWATRPAVTDGANRRIEDCLNQFVEALVRDALEIQARRRGAVV